MPILTDNLQDVQGTQAGAYVHTHGKVQLQ